MVTLFFHVSFSVDAEVGNGTGNGGSGFVSMISLEESFVSLSWSSSVLLILDCFIKTLSLLLGLSILLSSSAVFIYSLYTIQSPNTMLESSLLLDRFVLYLVSVSFILFLISLNNQFILHSSQRDPFLKIPPIHFSFHPSLKRRFLNHNKTILFWHRKK